MPLFQPFSRGMPVSLFRPHVASEAAVAASDASDAAVAARYGLSSTEEVEKLVVFPAHLVVFGPCWDSHIHV